MNSALVGLTLEVSTPFLVVGASCLAIAVAFAWRSAEQEDAYSKYFNHRGRGLKNRLRPAPPKVVYKHIVLLPDGTRQDAAEYAAKKNAAAANAAANAAAAAKFQSSGQTLPMTEEERTRASLALDLAWLEEQYRRDPSLESIDAQRARKIVQQLADAEPDRMVMLLRRWLREEHFPR